MTDDLYTLDEEIAEAREWFVDDLGVWIEPQNEDESICDIWNRHTWGGSGVTRWSESDPPPFSSSWALAGPLLEEMGGPGAGFIWSARSADGRAAWVAGWRDADERSIGSRAYGSPCEAVARAWLAWHRSKA